MIFSLNDCVNFQLYAKFPYMGQHSRLWSKLFVVVLIFAAVFMFFRFNRPQVVLVMDKSFSIAYPASALEDFKKDLGREGYNLKQVVADSETFMDSVKLETLLSEYSDCALMLTSPVISTAVRAGQIELSSLIKGLAVGMTTDCEDSFDIVLSADPDSMPEGTYYLDTIGKTDVAGLIYPDLGMSIIPLLKMDKTNLTVSEAVTVYEVR